MIVIVGRIQRVALLIIQKRAPLVASYFLFFALLLSCLIEFTVEEANLVRPDGGDMGMFNDI